MQRKIKPSGVNVCDLIEEVQVVEKGKTMDEAFAASYDRDDESRPEVYGRYLAGTAYMVRDYETIRRSSTEYSVLYIRTGDTSNW